MESVTSAPVVQQVVPNIGENNKVNFTVTTFSVVEVGTPFALMIIFGLFMFLSQSILFQCLFMFKLFLF